MVARNDRVSESIVVDRDVLNRAQLSFLVYFFVSCLCAEVNKAQAVGRGL